MAQVQIKVKGKLASGGAYSKTLSGDTMNDTNVHDVNDAKRFASKYAKIVDATFEGGEYHKVETFKA